MCVCVGFASTDCSLVLYMPNMNKVQQENTCEDPERASGSSHCLTTQETCLGRLLTLTQAPKKTLVWQKHLSDHNPIKPQDVENLWRETGADVWACQVTCFTELAYLQGAAFKKHAEWFTAWGGCPLNPNLHTSMQQRPKAPARNHLPG